MLGLISIALSEGILFLVQRPVSRSAHLDAAGEALRRICERGGGFLPKLGQIIATRPDIVPLAVCNALGHLQDDMKPASRQDLQVMLQRLAAKALSDLQSRPIASASIAQIHLARRTGSRAVVALKLLRPGVQRRLGTDLLLAQWFGSVLALLPGLRSIPFEEALIIASDCIRAQADLSAEARSLERFAGLFDGLNWVQVPRVHFDLCDEGVLAMEYIAGLRKLTDPSIPDAEARRLTVLGLRALYIMIFLAGFVHCDFHPGNILAVPDGRIVILDAGLVAEIDDHTRRDFAEFFMSIARNRGARAAEIVLRTATNVPADLDTLRFVQDIRELIGRVCGLTARDFGVSAFANDLFAIQTRHHMRGSPKFTMAIVALLVYEGLAKQRCADLDFQREAGPFALAALTLSEVRASNRS
jgi:ubiquinone biosynthesis protein